MPWKVVEKLIVSPLSFVGRVALVLFVAVVLVVGMIGSAWMWFVDKLKSLEGTGGTYYVPQSTSGRRQVDEWGYSETPSGRSDYEEERLRLQADYETKKREREVRDAERDTDRGIAIQQHERAQAEADQRRDERVQEDFAKHVAEQDAKYDSYFG